MWGWRGASTLPFTNCPSGGTSSMLEAGEVGDSLAFGPKEEVAIASSGCERAYSSSKKMTQSWRPRQEEILQPSSMPLPPPIHSPGWCLGLDRVICIDDAQCFTNESFRKRRHDNTNVFQGSLMDNHLVTKMQRFIATEPTILLRPDFCVPKGLNIVSRKLLCVSM